MSKWVGPDGEIGRYVREESERTLEAYRAQPNLVEEQANQEQDTARGGYANRQVVELVQNSADQIAKVGSGRIYIRLTDSHLYCADNGAPLDQDGAKALLFSHLSPKRATAEIGRFGVGFKSVLRVTDKPAVFSRSGSIQFDRQKAKRRITSVAPDAQSYPVLRVAEPIDLAAAKTDPELAALMRWARNVVRLSLKPGSYDELAEQLRSFAPEFLLFVPHVHRLDIVSDAEDESRSIRLTSAGGQIELNDGGQRSHWMLFNHEHELSDDAKADSRALDDAERVKIAWAAPLDTRNPLQQFWAFFPTQTSSLVGGILNAPWKTNEDRQNLLPGIYNDELIGAAAQLVADSLPRLYTAGTPARHLDVLPRRAETGDPHHAILLRQRLYALLEHAAVAPDQTGALRSLQDLRVAPEALTPGQRVESVPLARWFAYEHHPTDWLHHDALTNDRLAALARIYVGGRFERGVLPRSSIAEWLTALTEAGERKGDAVRASMSAIQTAALIPEAGRLNKSLGRIALTESGEWAVPDPDSIYLSGDDPTESVHPDLEADPETLKALRALGIRAPSAESRLRNLAKGLAVVRDDVDKDPRWPDFWQCARDCGDEITLRVIDEAFRLRAKVRVRTENGTWEPIFAVLMPGKIVTRGDTPAYVVADVDFHAKDRDLLSKLGVVAEPHGRAVLAGGVYQNYLNRCRETFQRKSAGWPQLSYLGFDERSSSGPLDAFRYLSDGGKARFAEALLDLDATYQSLTMRHATRPEWGTRRFLPPAVSALRDHGMVEIDGELHPLSSGLGDDPEQPDMQAWLLQHPRTQDLRRVFRDLRSDYAGSFETVNDDEPVPLLDEWPGLRDEVRPEHEDLDLVRCDALVSETGEALSSDCLLHGNTLVMRRQNDEGTELRKIILWLGVELDPQTFEAILSHRVSRAVDEARDAVRQQKTDAERLLAAVGRESLIDSHRLPKALVELLSGGGQGIGGLDAAKAAIATFHTGALREYRHAIGHLGPPKVWAGRPAALEFVAALGFGPEWAGQPNPKRDPFIDVAGPRSLPDLHDYQQTVVGNVRTLLRSGPLSGENRGLLSLPTGSGKTRVAVQAIIEAIRDDGFRGTVLWVADRDELCEQAVEVWQQAWASIGPEAEPLRVSRWWAGQRSPQAPGGHHVVVATIQTLRARIASGAAAEVLEDVAILVVDEAHGSIAPSYTQLMSGLGLTFRRTDDEIALLGLTATPYRGIDPVNTARLVNRYGTNRLDFGAFDSDDPEEVISQLQEMTVLANVDHDVITGATVQLSAQHLAQAQQSPWLPEAVEQRLADDPNRTTAILDAYMTQVRSLGSVVPTLIFATSVAHAETIAALLSLDGIAARAVSGKTETSVRRSIVEQFRAGEIDVLVNYGVFREGFDAPKTRAIIVARPVYSPNLYFQMIGRGLRGELNGGSERCLILDVKDNIQNYNRSLAFSELDWLWSEPQHS